MFIMNCLFAILLAIGLPNADNVIRADDTSAAPNSVVTFATTSVDALRLFAAQESGTLWVERQKDDGKKAANQPAVPLKIHMIGHGEYSPAESLTTLKKHLEKNFRVECTMSLKLDKNRLDNLDSLKNADVLVLLARRMNLAKDQMEIIRNHWESGKPIVGIRTASHAFQKDDNEVLDKKVFGGNYTGTDGGKFTLAAGAADHPVLKGVQPFRVGTYLYQQGKLADGAAILQLQGNTPQTWVHTYKGGRMFYTSGGAVADFGNENFLRLLSNAIFWTSHRNPETMAK